MVSAMGGTTDELLTKAKGVSAEPNARELDMLLSVGERISTALLDIAVHDLGVPAVSFTGCSLGSSPTPGTTARGSSRWPLPPDG